MRPPYESGRIWTTGYPPAEGFTQYSEPPLRSCRVMYHCGTMWHEFFKPLEGSDSNPRRGTMKRKEMYQTLGGER